MKVLTLVINIVLSLFTCFVLATDGLPNQPIYIIFALWMIFTLILNITVLSLKEVSNNLKLGAIVFNIIFTGIIAWSLVDQYPHPEESGFIEYVVLTLLNPVFTIVAFIRKKKTNNSIQARTTN
jgi:hypothetical protein